jgi:hypothetical protein
MTWRRTQSGHKLSGVRPEAGGGTLEVKLGALSELKIGYSVVEGRRLLVLK